MSSVPNTGRTRWDSGKRPRVTMTTMDTALLTLHPAPLHLGALHPAEQVAVYVLAFGPFAVLALVVVLRRRAERGDQRDR